MLIGDWSFPTAIRFGANRIVELPEACAAAGIARPLLVTDRDLMALPIVQEALAILDRAGLGRSIFCDVDPNPDEGNLDAGIDAFQAGNHDGVVAFGGGSALDLGKLIAFMARQTRLVWDFEDIGDWWRRADADVIYPSVTVPTTAGTGSEVGRAGVITNSRAREKKIIFHPKMLPAQVIADPNLTMSMPSHITVGTGMDAFAHGLEAYCAPGFHPMADGIALECMRLVKDNIRLAVREPANLEARSNMLAAAAMGAVAFQKGLGAIHALSHAIGANFGTHHGMTNAVLMPFVLRFNHPAIDTRLDRAAHYLGIDRGFDGFMELVLGLRAELGVPFQLRELGVEIQKFDTLIDQAIRDPTVAGNPVPFKRDAARRILDEAF